MSKLILARRALLFAAPALVAAASIMKVRSIDRLFFKEYDEIAHEPAWYGSEQFIGRTRADVEGHLFPLDATISQAEFEWNKKRLLKGQHVNVGKITKHHVYDHIIGGKFITGA